jgi:hypothetical protein
MSPARQKMIWRGQRRQTLDLTPMLPAELLLCRASVQFRQTDRIPVLEPQYTGTISVRAVVGTLRHLRLEHAKLTGVMFWASDAAANRVQRGFESGELLPCFEYFVFERMDSGRPGLEFVTRWQPLAIQLRRRDGIA